MTKWYGLNSNSDECLYLGEYDLESFTEVANVANLLQEHGIAYYIDWIFSDIGLERFIGSALEALGAKVDVEVRSGVADIEAPDYIPVELTDYDVWDEE